MATVKLILHNAYKKETALPKVNGPRIGSYQNETTRAEKRKKILSNKEARLYCVLIIDRKHIIKVKTQHTILPKNWDFKKQGKKEILAGALEFNSDLQTYRSEILDKYNDTIKKNPDLTFKAVCKIIQDFGKKKEVPFLDENKEFFQVLDEFIKVQEGESAPGTIKKFNTLKKSLMAFGTENKQYENLTFSMIDHRFKDSYTKYLRDQKPRGRQKNRPEGQQLGLLNDTIGKYIECLKTFCKWAQERNYNRYVTYSEFSNFTQASKKRKKQQKDIVTLSLQELMNLYNHDFSKQATLDHVRDLFCFGACTGQRWSDIERLNRQDIKGTLWRFTAYKTKKTTEIDLMGYAAPALDILKKYDYHLPKISLTKFNLYIKEAANEAGINTPTKIVRYVGSKEISITKPKYKFIGSHTARKTCVSILLNVYNLNVTHVLEITGHSDLKTLQKYIDKDREARREAISKTKAITDIKLTVAV